MTRPIDLTQHVYGLLTVLRKVPTSPRNKWECICKCGAIVQVASKELRKGDTRSCGCIRKAQLVERNTSHGMTRTYTYRKWQQMFARIRDTTNPRNACYIGVTICKRWGKFENFLQDMGEAPDGYSLERKNNKRGYMPSNCHWIPLAQQAANTSKSRFTTVNGVRKHISAHARDRGMNPDVIFDRINKLGWDIKRALETPVRKQRRNNEN